MLKEGSCDTNTLPQVFVNNAVDHGVAIFRLMIPPMISMILMILAKAGDSPNRIMPSTAVPAAPIPVQMAYPVPTGMVFRATANNHTLSTMEKAKNTLGHSREKPSVYLRAIAHPISKRPATTR